MQTIGVPPSLPRPVCLSVSVLSCPKGEARCPSLPFSARRRGAGGRSPSHTNCLIRELPSPREVGARGRLQRRSGWVGGGGRAVKRFYRGGEFCGVGEGDFTSCVL